MEDVNKTLTEMFELYEDEKLLGSKHSQNARNIKKEMMNILKESGLESVIVTGSETDTVRLKVELVERQVLNKKKIAESLGIKVSELNDYGKWVELTSEGKVTPEMIENAREIEQREQLTIEPFEEEK